jgi:hypothetical protein
LSDLNFDKFVLQKTNSATKTKEIKIEIEANVKNAIFDSLGSLGNLNDVFSGISR